MNDIVSPFMLAPDVTTISCMGEETRTRLERSGMFPRRVKLGKRKIAYRRAEIEDWARDPEAWVAKQGTGDGQ